MDKMTLKSTVTLNNGVKMPLLGLGTFQSEQGEETRNAVLWALEAGYRHIDTAAVYQNEEDVGRAIRESGVARGEIFVTTKVWNDNLGPESTPRAYDQSLKQLGLDYVDLFLIHWPIQGVHVNGWRAAVKLYREGRVRAVGVSNYTPRHLREILAVESLVPAVNQFEVHPFNTRQVLVDDCREKGIQVESYSPLARGKKWGSPVVADIAKRYGKSPAQVLIRWALDKGFAVIPKSVHRERIVENAAVFDFGLTLEEVQSLDRSNENLHTINPPWMRGEWE